MLQKLSRPIRALSFFVLLLGLAFSSFGQGAPSSYLPPAAVAGKITAELHPLAAEINTFLTRQASLTNFKTTGLDRAAYLKVIDGEVRVMRQYQDATGRIIDPVQKKEVQYATPCYAHAVAALAASGFDKDPELLASGMLAMDAATTAMAAGKVADNHGDFFTYPAMLALTLYTKAAPAERVAKWRASLASVDPQKLYSVRRGGNNWAVVNLSGEWLRVAAGLTTGTAYLEARLVEQLKNFTPLGMYNEGGNPLPYDHFPRIFLAGIMQAGYRGASYAACRDLVWRGAWNSLFMMSPNGEFPTGYRSSQHIWNEAESAVTYELYSAQYAAAGRPAEAGAFKRAAHLSLQAIQRWLRPDGSGYIVKNRYPIEARHGYEDYSSYSQYNLLACSMLAQAWQFADEAIAERPAPADFGGYVIPILEPFHKIFASAGGTYAEFDTRGDHTYNPTGLLRVHVKGGNPQLGPSDGCAPKYSGRGVNLALGPSWLDAQGTTRSLAELSPATPKVEILSETPAKAAFRVTYEGLKGRGEQGAGVTLTETVTVEPAGVTVADELSGAGVKGLRVNYPMLVFDGLEKTDIQMQGNAVTLRLAGSGVKFAVTEPAGAVLRRTGKELGHRNGMVEPLYAEIAGLRASYRIEAAK